ncbi:MAG: hypothetical protein M1823_002192 [Watsoniomyces obsoletus]|nr:MAG: hypothetical protein M1823_002192 [Watsoniomyces obsoletus]
MARLRSWNVSGLQRTLQSSLLGLTLGVIIAALYRYIYIDARDPFKCGALLYRGRWLDPPENGQAVSLKNWQPPGCMLHPYNSNDITSCLTSKRMVFVGDSTIRQIFWATATKLSPSIARIDKERAERHTDLRFVQRNVSLDFIWDPFLNSTRLEEELQAYKREISNFDTRKDSQENRQDKESTSLLLIGGGLWFAEYADGDPFEQFKAAVDNVVRYTISEEKSFSDSEEKSFTQIVDAKNVLLLAPVQIPRYESLTRERSKITRDQVDRMNGYLQRLSALPGVDVLWSFDLMLHRQQSALDLSGIHVVDSVADKRTDVLLNLQCNGGSRGGQSYPYDRTCCSKYPRPGPVQWVLLTGGIGVLLAICVFKIQTWWRQRRASRSSRELVESQYLQIRPSRRVGQALVVFWLALCFCYGADRSQAFNKLHKQFSWTDFGILSGLTMALGVLSIRPSKASASRSKDSTITTTTNIPDQPFLSRDQTDEWKGWMQFVILVYHYTGASKEIDIYRIVRLLVASYLFMTGFGHTVFFLTKKDYSFRRVAGVLVRLNLLSCALPYLMRTDYLFYYFAPLVTFWFVIVWGTLGIYRSRNDDMRFLFGKIIVSAILVTGFIQMEGPLEMIFSLLRHTCRIEWDVREWRFRVSLDIFIVYIGMMSAMIFLELTSRPMLSEKGWFHRMIRKRGDSLHILSVIISMIILPTYWILTRHHTTKKVSNYWHPYISSLPVLGFIILRNAHRHLRNRHSTIFAWLGRCSLETFTLQFHIWLAADTKGLLSVGVFGEEGIGKWIEFGMLTAVFFWISSGVATATGTLTEWIISGGGGDEHGNGPSSSGTTQTRLETNQDGGHHDEKRELESGLHSKWSMGRWISEKTVRANTRFKKSLRIRILGMLLVLWILNLIYT